MPYKEKPLPEQSALSSGRWKLLFRNFFFFLLVAMSVAQQLDLSILAQPVYHSLGPSLMIMIAKAGIQAKISL